MRLILYNGSIIYFLGCIEETKTQTSFFTLKRSQVRPCLAQPFLCHPNYGTYKTIQLNIIHNTAWKVDLLVVVDITVALNQLSNLVRCVTRKEKVVLRLDGKGKAHEQTRIDAESYAERLDNCYIRAKTRQHTGSHVARNVSGVLLPVSNGSQRNTPVSNRAPEVLLERTVMSLLNI